MRIDPTKVQRALASASFPASRDDLVQSAGRNDAGEDIMDALESLPDEQYNDVDSVMSAIEGQPS